MDVKPRVSLGFPTTSLVLAVPFTLDLQYATNAIANRLYAPIPLLIVAALWYLVVTSVLMVGQYFKDRTALASSYAPSACSFP